MTNIEEALAEANKGAAVNVLSGICDIVQQWDEQGKEIERLRERCDELERELEGAYDKLDRVGNKLIDMAQRPASADPETAGKPSRNGDGCPDQDADGDFAMETSRESDIGRERPEDDANEGANEDGVPNGGDSWGKWRTDLHADYGHYCKVRGLKPLSSWGAESFWAEDLERRAKKLAGVVE